MADIEITDEASLEAWLRTRPRRDAEIIAFRAAARVFPLWGRAMEEEWAREVKLSSLPILRCLEISNVQVISQELNLLSFHVAVGNAQLGTDECISLAEAHGGFGAASAANAATFSTDVEIAALASEIAATFDQFWIPDDSWKQISRDISNFEEKNGSCPLWPTPAPEWFTTADRETRAIWAKDQPTWAFWEKWWDGVISGDMPFAPELLRDVALIDDDIWQAGPKAVAGRINLLIQRHALQREAAAINSKLMEFISLTEGLGANLHNHPPDEELSPVKLRATLREISQALKDIEVALDGPEISPEVVVGLGQRLKDLWDGLTTKMKIAIGGLAIVCVTGFSQGFLGAAGEDFYQLVKRNIDIPGFSRRLLEFGKELEKPYSPAPVFPSRPPVDL